MSGAVDLRNVEPSTDYDFEEADRPCLGRAVGRLDACTAARMAGVVAAAVTSAFLIGRFVGRRRRPGERPDD